MRKLISFVYKNVLKKILFKFDPEFIHDLFTIKGQFLAIIPGAKQVLGKILRFNHPSLEQTIHGIQFKNPVGLSAGFDKDCKLPQILPYVGFGFSQVGSVTLNSYEGNPQPRLHRLPKSKGIVVYYGLKNEGIDKIMKRFKRQSIPKDFPVSFSIAKTNCSATAETDAGIQDYTECLSRLNAESIGDFYTINISCPNTFGGEPFTTPTKLEKLFKSLITVKTTKPIFVKMPINLAWRDFNKLLKVVVKNKAAGVIIGNLTKERDPKLIRDEIPTHIKGGISGKPTEQLNNNLIAKTYIEYGNKLTIIGVGGIFSAKDAYEKIKRGATLVQLITGMIFEGPQLIGEINSGLVEQMTKDGYTHISQAVGAYYHKPK